MREKTKQLDKDKLFALGILVLLIIYGVLWFMNALQVQLVKEYEYGPLEMTYYPLRKKYNVPFPFGWMFILEWIMPLMVCLAYAAVAKGWEKLYSTVSAVMLGGFFAIFFAKTGLSAYMITVPISTRKHDLYEYFLFASPKLGGMIPNYFVLWALTALVIIFTAKKAWKSASKSKKTQVVCLLMVFLFSLSEGILFHIVYSGVYTIFYIARSCVILMICLLNVYYLNKKATFETDLEQDECEVNAQGKYKKIMMFAFLFLLLAIVIFIMQKPFEILLSPGNRSVYNFLIYFKSTVYIYMPVIVALEAAIYTLRGKHSEATFVVNAVFISIAFSGYHYLISFLTNWKAEILYVFSAIIYLFLLLWDSYEKKSKVITILANVLFFCTAILYICIWEGAIYRKIVGSVLCFGMLLIMLWTILVSDSFDKKDITVNKGLIGILVLLIGYMGSLILNILRCFIIESIVRKISSIIELRHGITVMFYLFPMFLLLTCLAHSLNKKNMYIFAMSLSFISMYFVENNSYETSLALPVPIFIALVIILLFIMPILEQLFRKRSDILGMIITLVSSAVYVYYYIVPLFKMDISEYRAGAYIGGLIILCIFIGIAVLTYIRRMKEEKIKEAHTTTIL